MRKRVLKAWRQKGTPFRSDFEWRYKVDIYMSKLKFSELFRGFQSFLDVWEASPPKIGAFGS